MPKRLDINAPYWTQMRVAERSIIEYAYHAGRTLRRTAELLGISIPHLRRRIAVLGLGPEIGLRSEGKAATPPTPKRKRKRPAKKPKAVAKPSTKPVEAPFAVPSPIAGEPREPRELVQPVENNAVEEVAHGLLPSQSIKEELDDDDWPDLDDKDDKDDAYEEYAWDDTSEDQTEPASESDDPKVN